MLTLAHHLSSAGHTVSVFAYESSACEAFLVERSSYVESLDLPLDLTEILCSVEYPLKFHGRVKEFDPDLLLSQFFPSVLGAVLNREYGIPHVSFLRSPTYVVKEYTGNSGNALLDYAYAPIRALHEQTFRVIRKYTDLFVANSQHTCSLYRSEWGISPEVVYPFVDVDAYRTSTTGDSILHVNPSHHKGIRTTIEVAKRMSETSFLVVGNTEDPEIEEELSNTSNIGHLGHVEDMRRAYRRTKIALMPSHWEEPFGRIPVEAGINGIPVLCSGKGGLREAVGSEELVVETNDSADYVEAIHRVEEDYEVYAETARENSISKSSSSQFQRFVDVVDRELAVQL